MDTYAYLILGVPNIVQWVDYIYIYTATYSHAHDFQSVWQCINSVAQQLLFTVLLHVSCVASKDIIHIVYILPTSSWRHLARYSCDHRDYSYLQITSVTAFPSSYHCKFPNNQLNNCRNNVHKYHCSSKRLSSAICIRSIWFYIPQKRLLPEWHSARLHPSQAGYGSWVNNKNSSQWTSRKVGMRSGASWQMNARAKSPRKSDAR